MVTPSAPLNATHLLVYLGEILIPCLSLLCSYDYSGYGQSTGKVHTIICWKLLTFFIISLMLMMLTLHLYLILQPSEQNTYADIEAVYRCLIETYGASEDNIILYGQSVGSGPTLDLASRLARLRAVVLHSPILSGLRVMYPVKHTYWFDIYKVINILMLLIFVNC